MDDKSLRAIANHGMAILDAMADSWAEEVDLTSMIKDATSPLNEASSDAENVLRNRGEARIYAIVRQAFQEGALEAIANLHDEQDRLRALGVSRFDRRGRP